MTGPDQTSAVSDVRLAVDIGGTFTDLVLEVAGQQHTHKCLTTHDAPANAVLTGVRTLLSLANVAASSVGVVLHGTTLATNALIERRGASTALFTTVGHRDTIAMASENRFEQYDINIDRPEPLVPRALRLPIVERLAADGEVLLPLDEASVRMAIDIAQRQGASSVAVGLLHSYANAQHEQTVGELLQRHWPEASITLSSEVCPEIREFERFSTACANAYVKPLMSSYLEQLQHSLMDLGVTAPILLMTSGGGLTTLDAARAYPIRLVESGPAGGAMLAAHLAAHFPAQYGVNDVLSFDMGGTTAKLCLIDNHEPLLSRAFEVDRQYRFKKGSGLPVRIPVIEMVEIGAGGGSIASVDRLQRIQVGPRSAGSDPGPACYGLGGTEPTVTDADVVLGKIPGASLGDGAVLLEPAAARGALAQRVGEPLTTDAITAAFGVSEVVDETMAAACRAHATEWGKGVSNRLLIAFGGAAPLHAARLAQVLRLSQVLIPANAGVGSAIGFLLAPVRFEVVRSRFMLLSDFTTAAVQPLLEAMREEALAVVRPVLPAQQPVTEQLTCYMRYAGQGYEIAVAVPDQNAGLSADRLHTAFEAAYKALYGRVIAGQEVEILSWTMAVGADVAPHVAAKQSAASAVAHADQRQTSVPLTQPHGTSFESVEASLHFRAELLPGTRINGPALVQETHTTTVVPVGAKLEVLADGGLLIQLETT